MVQRRGSGDILVVDDTPANLQLLAGMLTEHGYVVRSAPSGRLALRFIEESPPDLILLDVRMPGMDGYEVCRQVKANPATRDIPVIFLSALDELADKLQGFVVGGVDYITKPFYAEEVLIRLKTHLALREMQEQLKKQNAQLQMEIEARERTQAELQTLNAELEQRVTERTEALLLANAELQLTLNALPDLLFEVDPQGKIYYVHAPSPDLFFQPPDGLVGCYLEQVLEPPTARVILNAVQESVRTGRHTGTLCSLETPLGMRWFELSAAAMGGPEFLDNRLVVLARDVTDRKGAQEEVLRLVGLVEQAAEAILIVDLTGKLVYANPYFEVSSGYTLFEALGENPWQLLQSQVRDENFRRELWETVTAGNTWAGILVNRHRDGHQYYEASTVFPVRASTGEIVNYAAVNRDITESVRVQAEREALLAQLQEQAHRVQRIVDSVPEGVLLLDARSEVQLANPLGQEHLALLGRIEAEGALTHLGSRPLPELLVPPPQGLWHEVEMGDQCFQVIARPVEPDSVSPEWVVVIRNVTQQREVERHIQQQERLAAVGQLAAGIAHDFNNTMAAIVLYSQMTARAPGLSARGQEYLQMVDQQAMHATKLIQQILDFSRSAIFERQPLDLLPLLKEQIRLLERTLPDNIQIELQYGEGDYVINGDPTRMRQVFMNLAVNARDAMPEGGRLVFNLERISITAAETAPLPEMRAANVAPGDWVRVAVSDTGTGIPPEVRPYIFEPFFTTKAAGQGSGLGLAQVHGIIGAHEGYIDVVSQVGQGTTLLIYLPALKHAPVEPSMASPEQIVEGQGEVLLVVEDNQMTRQALVESLTALNYQVLVAQNGKEALGVLDTHPDVALVISDWVMPEMGGRALFEALRRQGNPVKMIVLTGHPLGDEFDSLRADGISGWLFKPISLARLSEAVAQALRPLAPDSEG